MASRLQAAFNASTIALRDDCDVSNSVTSTTPPATQPHDLSSLLASLAPFALLARLPDWIKLAIIGSIIEACRRSVLWIIAYITAALTITARFEHNDISYGEHPAYRFHDVARPNILQTGFFSGCLGSLFLRTPETLRSPPAHGARVLLVRWSPEKSRNSVSLAGNRASCRTYLPHKSSILCGSRVDTCESPASVPRMHSVDTEMRMSP
jgi:hypothetical protein